MSGFSCLIQYKYIEMNKRKAMQQNCVAWLELEKIVKVKFGFAYLYLKWLGQA